MTLTLHWWVIALLIVGASILLGAIFGDAGPWDFVGLLWVLAGLLIAGGYVLGHYAT